MSFVRKDTQGLFQKNLFMQKKFCISISTCHSIFLYFLYTKKNCKQFLKVEWLSHEKELEYLLFQKNSSERDLSVTLTIYAIIVINYEI